MKTKTVLVVGLAALLGAGGFFAVQSQAASGAAFGHAKGVIAQRVVEKLGLSDDQIAQIKKVRDSEKDTVLAKLQDLNQARVGLRGVIQSGGNEAAVRSAHAKVA